MGGNVRSPDLAAAILALDTFGTVTFAISSTSCALICFYRGNLRIKSGICLVLNQNSIIHKLAS